jgi:hypothetical protein
MAFVPSAIFNILEGDANYRKIEAQVASVPALVGVSYNVYYKVEGPVAVLKLPDFNTPDGTLTPIVSLVTMPLVNLPLDSNGNTLEGNYTLTYYFEDTAALGVYTTIVSTINLNVLKEATLASCKIVPNLKLDVDCFCYNMTAYDNTLYALTGYDVTVNSRTLTIVIPTIPGVTPTPPPVSTTAASLTIGFDYSNVTYTVNLEAEYQHENADGTIIVLENLLATLSQKIVCDFNLCKLVECIARTMAVLEAKASKVGGWPNLPVYERDTIYQLQQLITLLEMYRDCGNYTKVYEIYNKIVALVGCDCGCDEQSGDTPIPVSPSCGGSGAVSSIVGTPPIIVLQAGLTATISLDPAFMAAALAGYTASNGLTESLSDIKLGGTLSQNTTIEGASAWTLTIQNILTFILHAVGTLRLQGAAALEIIGLAGLFIRTPKTDATTANNGDALVLIDKTTGRCDWTNMGNVLYFTDNPTNINYPDDGNIYYWNYTLPGGTLTNNGEYIEISATVTITGTSGNIPVVGVRGFSVFGHTIDQSFDQTIKGKIVRLSATTFFASIESFIYDTSGKFITSYIAESTGTFVWANNKNIEISISTGIGDHVTELNHYLVSKFKI